MTPSNEVICLLVALPPSHRTKKVQVQFVLLRGEIRPNFHALVLSAVALPRISVLGGFLIQAIRTEDFAFPSYTILELVRTSHLVSEQTLYVLTCEFHLIIDLLLKTSSLSLSHISWLVCQTGDSSHCGKPGIIARIARSWVCEQGRKVVWYSGGNGLQLEEKTTETGEGGHVLQDTPTRHAGQGFPAPGPCQNPHLFMLRIKICPHPSIPQARQTHFQ